MRTFREFLLEEGRKPGSVSKNDILRMWQNVRPSPILPRPVPLGHKGTRFHFDGVRITGRPDFINSVLARLKDFLAYERAQGTRLDVEYRKIDSKGRQDALSAPDYVFYAHVAQETPKPVKNVVNKSPEPPRFKPIKPVFGI